MIDDEPLALARLRRMLRFESDIVIVGECENGLDAITAIRELKPDLVLLDIQMPGMDGFEVLETIMLHYVPVTIFITAYDQYAIRAFDTHALDYLLKPVNKPRFQRTLNRVREQLKKNDLERRSELFDALLSDLKAKKKYLERFILKSNGRVYFLKTDDVDWIEASGNYVNLHVGRQVHLHRETMSSVETRLDPGKFVRIHRSTIVNIEHIKEMFPLFNGDYTLILNDNTELVLSRNYRNRLLD